MHSTACCEGILRSQPGRHGSRPGRSSASERSPHTVPEQRSSTSSPTPPDPAAAAAGSTPPARNVGRVGRAIPSSPCLAAGAAGAGATRPDPVGHVAGRANGGSLPHHWAGGQCAVVSLVSGVSWAARWCAGPLEPTDCAEPLGLMAGAVRLGTVAGLVLPRVDRQWRRLGCGPSPHAEPLRWLSGSARESARRPQSSVRLG